MSLALSLVACTGKPTVEPGGNPSDGIPDEGNPDEGSPDEELDGSFDLPWDEF